MIPAVTYKLNGLWQAVKTADRPLCAMASAAHYFSKGDKLGGAARGLSGEAIHAAIMDGVLGENIMPEHWYTWLNGLNEDRLGKCACSVVSGTKLDPYQVDAVKNLTVAGGVVAMGCGLGKTITALSAAFTLASFGRLWIACPLNAIPAWEAHLPWMNKMFTEVEIISIDSLHKAKAVAPFENSCIIYDEVHMLGNRTARRTKAAHKVRAAFKAGICLTGTFLHGGVEKCLSMLDLAVPGAARFSNRWNCGKHFRCIIERKIGQRVVRDLAKPSQRMMHDFNVYLSPFCQSLNKDSVTVKESVDLPAQHVHDIVFPFSETVDEAAVRLAQEKFDATGELPSMQEIAHELSRDGIDLKLQWLDSMMGASPVVLFCTYHASLDVIEEYLIQKGITYTRVDGGVTGKQRSVCLDDFTQGKVQVFLAQTDAASVSMNLQRSHVSVMFDSTWKAANYDQALARTCRRGQDKTCHHFNLIANAFQQMAFKRVQSAMDFDASVAQWQETKAAIDAVGITV